MLFDVREVVPPQLLAWLKMKPSANPAEHGAPDISASRAERRLLHVNR